MSDAEDLVEDFEDELDGEPEFELVTSPRMLGSAPPLRKQPVTLPGWKTKSGKAARFLVWELSSAGYAKYIEASRIYKDGVFKRFDTENQDFRFVSFTVRDPGGNRLWKTMEAAKAQFDEAGRANLAVLVDAANEVNSVKQEDTEGNSDGTPSDSSPTI